MDSLASTSSVMSGNHSSISSAERTETIANGDFLSQLPEEVILKIFGYLNAIQQTKCGEVSRRWRRLASDETLLAAFNPRNLSPLIKVFDELDWSKYVDMSAYGLTTEDISPCDVRKATALLERVLSCPLMIEIEGNAGITLLTIPKGLTFNTLVKLAGSPKVGNAPEFRYIWYRISSEIGDTPVDKTYRIVITNNVFNKSRNLSVSDQKALVRKIGCEMPRVLEATVLLVVTFMSSGERLYSDNPLTYTRCSELLDGYQLIVGGFSPAGVSLSTYFDDDCSGASGVFRKF